MGWEAFVDADATVSHWSEEYLAFCASQLEVVGRAVGAPLPATHMPVPRLAPTAPPAAADDADATCATAGGAVTMAVYLRTAPSFMNGKLRLTRVAFWPAPEPKLAQGAAAALGADRPGSNVLTLFATGGGEPLAGAAADVEAMLLSQRSLLLPASGAPLPPTAQLSQALPAARPAPDAALPAGQARWCYPWSGRACCWACWLPKSR